MLVAQQRKLVLVLSSIVKFVEKEKLLLFLVTFVQ